MSLKLKTDDDGFPLIQFDPTNETFNTVAAFLRDDLGVLLFCYDELLQGIQSVLAAGGSEWLWNGNQFLLKIKEGRAELIDKYGDAGLEAPPAIIDAWVLMTIVKDCRDYVSNLPNCIK